jgi:hypothetical protein
MEVLRLQRQDGLSERRAIKEIAKDPAYDNVFPYKEQRDVRRVTSRPRREDALRVRWESREERMRQSREVTLRKRWELLKRRTKSDPKRLERALGLTTSASVMHIMGELDIFPEPLK